jgi:tryptophan synthase beta chain
MAPYQVDNQGYYGEFGGQYVPEVLLPSLDELEEAFETYREDPDFLSELNFYHQHLTGRPSPLIFAQNLTQKLGGAKIYLKNEGNNFTGSHKINHCLYHALLAKKMGKTEIIAETGAGQHGFAVATVCAKFGLQAKIFMGQKDIDKQYPNVFWMKQLGAKIIPVTKGNQKLTEASDAALGEWMQNPNAYFMLGSVVGPHPFPEIVREAQKIVSREIRQQLSELEKPETLPNQIIACIGGGSNAIGAFNNFLEEDEVELIGVEAGGTNAHQSGKHAARLSNQEAQIGIFEGFKSYFLMTPEGQMQATGGLSAGLGYVGIGPIHAYLHQQGRLHLTHRSDQEAIQAFQTLAQHEGILGALESCHALAEAIEQAPQLDSEKVIVVNLSGRADNYLFNVAGALQDSEFKNFCHKISSN